MRLLKPQSRALLTGFVVVGVAGVSAEAEGVVGGGGGVVGPCLSPSGKRRITSRIEEKFRLFSDIVNISLKVDYFKGFNLGALDKDAG
jgi:hypothetical protein